jgi:hypothetical protein
VEAKAAAKVHLDGYAFGDVTSTPCSAFLARAGVLTSLSKAHGSYADPLPTSVRLQISRSASGSAQPWTWWVALGCSRSRSATWHLRNGEATQGKRSGSWRTPCAGGTLNRHPLMPRSGRSTVPSRRAGKPFRRCHWGHRPLRRPQGKAGPRVQVRTNVTAGPGGSSPTRPSMASRMRSAWPVWRPYSSIMSTIRRRTVDS